MNFIEKIKIREQKPKAIFGRYFLPFSTNEVILLVTFLMFLFFVFMAFIKSNFSIIVALSFLTYLLVFTIILLHRFFKEIKTNLSFEDNISIVKDIASKQKKVYYSKDLLGIYIFEISQKRDKEYIVIICENNKILINNFYNRKLYDLFNNNSIKAIKALIFLKAKTLLKNRIHCSQ